MGDEMTVEDFDKMTPWLKGYCVYMFGARKDYPAIPSSYTPTRDEEAEYREGQHDAMLEAQEGDD